MSAPEFLKLFIKAFKEWVHDRADGLAASIAYYQLMSLAPFVALMVLASSAIFGKEQSKAEVEPLIAQFLHPQFVTAMKYILRYSFELDQGKFLAITALGIFSLVHGTFGYFEQMKDSIETFWNKRTEEANIKARMKKKVEALLMGSVCFVLLMFGFVAAHWFVEAKGLFQFLAWMLIEFTVFFSIIFFLLIYCPPVKFHWKDALPGVLITTILYLIGRIVLRNILNKQNEDTEDIAATLILYLLWAYYSSLVFLFGAEFAKLYIKKKQERET